MTCARCLEQIQKGLRYRYCTICRKHYHRGECYKLHRKQHMPDDRKYFNSRRFFE